MPAEISFFVPESYHKRIIGVGGKNIQRIMKKYGVYVKFSNAEEYEALGGYYKNEDNVIARTPSKNSMNLAELHGSIVELLTHREKGDEKGTVIVLPQFHRLVDSGSSLRNIDDVTFTDINLPLRESGSEIIEIIGTDAKIKEAKNMVLDMVPESVEINIPVSKNARDVLASTDFGDILKRVDKEFEAQIYLYIPEDDIMISVMMHYPKSKAAVLEKMKAVVLDFLEEKKVSMDFEYSAPEFTISTPPSTDGKYASPPPEIKSPPIGDGIKSGIQSPSTYDSFQHFNSKFVVDTPPPPSAVVVTPPAIEAPPILPGKGKGSNYSLFDSPNLTFDLDDV